MGAPDDPLLRRDYAAATISRLTASLAHESDYINYTLRTQLRTLRARSRQAAANQPYARRFANMVVANVAGPNPFVMQAKGKFGGGRLDTNLNRRHEDLWRAWGRPGACEFTGRWSRAQLIRTAVRTLAVDGEVFLQLHRDAGPHGLMVQLIDSDRLDESKNETLRNGNSVVMGIEVDPAGRPVAYHVARRKPSDWLRAGPREYQVLPADDVIHLFIPEHAEQVRGVPWIYAALLNLVHLGAFEEAAVIAAQVGASQMGFLQTPDGERPEGWAQQIEANPGTFPVLPPGVQLSTWNPAYPDAAVEPFMRSCMRGVAAGLDVAYHNLTGDMTQVNYSSARIAELDERDMWMTLQNVVVEHLMERLHQQWTLAIGLRGLIGTDARQRERLQSVYFQPRRWAWVDPAKEMDAAERAVALRIKSRTRIAAEQGEDIEDTFDELAAEQQLAADKGVALDAAPKPAATTEPAVDDKDEDDQ